MPKDQTYIEENFSFSSDDDDDAPAEVSSSKIKKNKLSQVQSQRQQDKEAKEKVKEKRRKRDELFKSQKNQKLITFGKRALPDDVLEAVSSKDSKKKENEESDKANNVKDGEDNDDSGNEKSDDRLSGSDFDDFDPTNEDFDSDFISLDSSKQSGVKVVTVDATTKNKSSLENALAFKQSRLYTSSGIAPPRETANQRRGRLLKKKQLQAK